MPKSKHHTNKGSGELMPTSSASVLDKIDACLRDQLRTFPSKGALEPEEFEHWHRDLGPFTTRAIEWAFDNHRRNGRFFPAYGEILDQVVAWQPDPTKGDIATALGCSPQCKARHGKGYHFNDMMILYKMYVAKRQEVNGPLKKPEILGLFDELDKIRGRAPEWRLKQ
jgi:hypothetical protein